MLRSLLKSSALALGGFHAWLFVRQVASGDLASPGTLLKWLAAAALIAALVALRRQGVPLLRGRKAIAVWALAGLLHAPAIGDRIATLDTPVIPEVVITLSKSVASVAPLVAALLLLFIAREHAAARSAMRRASAVFVAPALRPPRASRRFAPRPPPVR